VFNICFVFYLTHQDIRPEWKQFFFIIHFNKHLLEGYVF
jgi:hypothetical protein